MASRTFKTKMNQAKKLWGKARERAQTESPFNELPDGRYQVALKNAEINESQSSGRLQIAWEYLVVKGKHKKETVREFQGMETEDNLVWLARRIEALGYEPPESFEDVEEIVADLLENKDDFTLTLKLTTKGEYQNIRLLKVLDAGDDDESVATDEEEPDDVEGEEEDDEEEDDEEEDDEEEDDEEEAEADDEEESDDDGEDEEDEEDADDEEEEGDDEESDDEEEEDESDDEEEADEEEAEEGELNVGDRVEYTFKGSECEGEVVALTDDGIKVKDDESGRTRTVKDGKYAKVVEDDSEAEEEEADEEEVPDEPEEKPRKASRRKPAKKAAKKTATKKTASKKSAPAKKSAKKTSKKSVSRRKK